MLAQGQGRAYHYCQAINLNTLKIAILHSRFTLLRMFSPVPRHFKLVQKSTLSSLSNSQTLLQQNSDKCVTPIYHDLMHYLRKRDYQRPMTEVDCHIVVEKYINVIPRAVHRRKHRFACHRYSSQKQSFKAPCRKYTRKDHLKLNCSLLAINLMILFTL